jgi:hypothetical protein
MTATTMTLSDALGRRVMLLGSLGVLTLTSVFTGDPHRAFVGAAHGAGIGGRLRGDPRTRHHPRPV